MIWPTLLQATNVVIGIEIFYKPGFRLHNMAMSFMATGKLGPEGFRSVIDMSNAGNDLIQLGYEWIKIGDEALDKFFLTKSILDLRNALLITREIKNNIRVQFTLMRAFNDAYDTSFQIQMRAAIGARARQLMKELMEAWGEKLLTLEQTTMDVLQRIIRFTTE